MALTFPDDTTQPYVDPTSGLKYVYNDAVGAWESAIQPPVIVTNSPPDIDLTGFLWYDQVAGATKIRLGDEWISIVPVITEDPDTGELQPFNLVKISVDPPANPTHGELWWDSSLGRLFIYYVDETPDAQWLEASPNIDGINGGIAFSGPSPPSGAVEGELWFNTQTQEMYVFFNNAWVPIKSVIDGVETLTAIPPLNIQDTDDKEKNPIIEIAYATSANSGAVRLATGDEASFDPLADSQQFNKVALTPLSLQNVLEVQPDIYIADATEARKGIVQLATVAEAQAGDSSTTVVTPQGLKNALDASGDAVACGTVIMFANGIANQNQIPPGYLVCNGDPHLRTTYSDLFGVIGELYGAGDGTTTFNVPDMRGNAIDGLQHGVYLIKT